MMRYEQVAVEHAGAVPGSSPWWGRAFALWGSVALLAIVPISIGLDAAVPILTFVWIGVPLALVARSKNAQTVGFCAVPWPLLLRIAAINLGLLFGLMIAFEASSHAYQRLLDFVVTANPVDSTFAWLVRYPRFPALVGMTLYSGLITMFGEELFFRGFLLQFFCRRMSTSRAIVLQAALFAVPNLVAATVLAPLEAFVYVVGYAWLAIGVVGGWAAARTGSIWPSLLSATLGNLAFVSLYVQA